MVGTAFEEEEPAFDDEDDLRLTEPRLALETLMLEDEEDLWTLA